MREKGTPKTLSEAIDHALEAWERDEESDSKDDFVELLRKTIADFFKNKLSPVMLLNENEEIEEILEKIVTSLK